LGFIGAKRDQGLSTGTIRNALKALARVFSIALREERITRNPATGLGELMRRVDRRGATEVEQTDAWTRDEVEALLRVAWEREPRFAPFLLFLVSTGARRGEGLGLQWEDIDFDRSKITIRRALTAGQLTTPKNGKARYIAMPPPLAEAMLDLLAYRHREQIERGWPEVPLWVFCTEAGTPFDERNCQRVWYRVRRRAQKLGVRPLKLHTARHSFASMALAAGKSLRWVADQLGHSSPAFTLKTYAHAMPEEEVDLSFASFGGGTKRHYTAPIKNGAEEKLSNPAKTLVELRGIEPLTLRLPA
jgi:integrase